MQVVELDFDYDSFQNYINGKSYDNKSKLKAVLNRAKKYKDGVSIQSGTLKSYSPLPSLNKTPPDLLDFFKCPDGKKFVLTDLWYAEIGIALDISGETDFAKLIPAGKDIHQHIASICFGKPGKEITSDERNNTKFELFHILYGSNKSNRSLYEIVPKLYDSVIKDSLKYNDTKYFCKKIRKSLEDWTQECITAISEKLKYPVISIMGQGDLVIQVDQNLDNEEVMSEIKNVISEYTTPPSKYLRGDLIISYNL